VPPRLAGFETITMAPIDLVEPSMLTREERDWLNAYHAQVRAVVAPAMADNDNRAWLVQSTRAI